MASANREQAKATRKGHHSNFTRKVNEVEAHADKLLALKSNFLDNSQLAVKVKEAYEKAKTVYQNLLSAQEAVTDTWESDNPDPEEKFMDKINKAWNDCQFIVQSATEHFENGIQNERKEQFSTPAAKKSYAQVVSPTHSQGKNNETILIRDNTTPEGGDQVNQNDPSPTPSVENPELDNQPIPEVQEQTEKDGSNTTAPGIQGRGLGGRPKQWPPFANPSDPIFSAPGNRFQNLNADDGTFFGRRTRNLDNRMQPDNWVPNPNTVPFFRPQFFRPPEDTWYPQGQPQGHQGPPGHATLDQASWHLINTLQNQLANVQRQADANAQLLAQTQAALAQSNAGSDSRGNNDLVLSIMTQQKQQFDITKLMVSFDGHNPKYPIWKNQLNRATIAPDQDEEMGNRGAFRLQFKTRKQVLTNFRRKFYKEYLLSLSPRRKWRDIVIKTPEVGQIVLIKDEKPHRLWDLARVTEVIMGRDNLPRNVMLLKSNGQSIKRNIGHVAILEENTEKSDLQKDNKSQ